MVSPWSSGLSQARGLQGVLGCRSGDGERCLLASAAKVDTDNSIGRGGHVLAPEPSALAPGATDDKGGGLRAGKGVRPRLATADDPPAPDTPGRNLLKELGRPLDESEEPGEISGEDSVEVLGMSRTGSGKERGREAGARLVPLCFVPSALAADTPFEPTQPKSPRGLEWLHEMDNRPTLGMLPRRQDVREAFSLGIVPAARCSTPHLTPPDNDVLLRG